MKKTLLLSAAILPIAGFAEGKKMPATSKTKGSRMMSMTTPDPTYHKKFFALMTEKHVRHCYKFFVEDAKLSKEDSEKLFKLISDRNLAMTLNTMDVSGRPEKREEQKQFYQARSTRNKETYLQTKAKIKILLADKFDSFHSYDKNSSMVSHIDRMNNTFIKARIGLAPTGRKALMKVLIAIRDEKGSAIKKEDLIQVVKTKAHKILSKEQLELLPEACKYLSSLPSQTLWYNQLPGLGTGINFANLEK